MVLAAFLSVAVAGLAAPSFHEGVSPEAPAYSLRNYICMSCHALPDDDSTLALEDLVWVTVDEAPQGAVGTPLRLPLRIENAWQANLLTVQATLDLSGAPSIGFSAGGEDPPQQWFEGEIPVARAFTGSGPVSTDRSLTWNITVPANLTDLRIHLASDALAPEARPDLRLAIWPATALEEPTPRVLVDEGGTGEPETFHVQGAKAIGALGIGTWRVEARMPGVSQARDAGPTAAMPQQVTLAVDGWSNATEEMARVMRLADLPEPDQREVDTLRALVDPAGLDIAWDLVALREPQKHEQIVLSVYAHQYYAHQTNEGDDDGYLVQNFTFPVAVTGTGEVRLAGSVGVAPKGPIDVFGAQVVQAGEVIGYTTGFLMIGSMLSGGVFGKGSRRAFNALFGTARRRVAFHNILSYGLTVGALAHTILFIVEARYHWALGLIWGGLGLITMLGLGVTGALQIPLIRRWSYPIWRWTHFGLATSALLFAIVHMLLDGQNFGAVQAAIGWNDPWVP